MTRIKSVLVGTGVVLLGGQCHWCQALRFQSQAPFPVSSVSFLLVRHDFNLSYPVGHALLLLCFPVLIDTFSSEI